MDSSLHRCLAGVQEARGKPFSKAIAIAAEFD